MSELQVSLLWRHGPDWLKNSLALRDSDGHTEMLEEFSDELKTKTTIWLLLKSMLLLVIS